MKEFEKLINALIVASENVINVESLPNVDAAQRDRLIANRCAAADALIAKIEPLVIATRQRNLMVNGERLA